MQVDFYQLSRDPVEAVVPRLAAKVLDSGERLLVVARGTEQLDTLSQALWEDPGFLAHGLEGTPQAARQPILLSTACAPANGARIALLADGVWREEAQGFARTMLLFDAAQTEPARTLWRRLSTGGTATLRIFKQTPVGGWRAGP
ncbi:DNA polymerase III subunit chi [Erythrobacteraceae bacterium CFH 75059]|uniref:DNA polymerase III subunit chi n=1 Tax=Qipengyuania thermophila TaxID=2509361 RepID=UPI00101EFA39|nr:DNA polymerase III subunit chi [Qipengyuania thermophila]TCD06338.1 DNA polymerase III subunit chi [Erythrobacteraceae bacterium CFH 75059]